MKSNLFDKNGIEIKVGNKYTTYNRTPKSSCSIYTVFWKGGALCGGVTYEEAIPLAWEIDRDDFTLVVDDNLSWLELITTNEV